MPFQLAGDDCGNTAQERSGNPRGRKVTECSVGAPRDLDIRLYRIHPRKSVGQDLVEGVQLAGDGGYSGYGGDIGDGCPRIRPIMQVDLDVGEDILRPAQMIDAHYGGCRVDRGKLGYQRLGYGGDDRGTGAEHVLALLPQRPSQIPGDVLGEIEGPFRHSRHGLQDRNANSLRGGQSPGRPLHHAARRALRPALHRGNRVRHRQRLGPDLVRILFHQRRGVDRNLPDMRRRRDPALLLLNHMPEFVGKVVLLARGDVDIGALGGCLAVQLCRQWRIVSHPHIIHGQTADMLHPGLEVGRQAGVIALAGRRRFRRRALIEGTVEIGKGLLTRSVVESLLQRAGDVSLRDFLARMRLRGGAAGRGG